MQQQIINNTIINKNGSTRYSHRRFNKLIDKQNCKNYLNLTQTLVEKQINSKLDLTSYVTKQNLIHNQNKFQYPLPLFRKNIIVRKNTLNLNQKQLKPTSEEMEKLKNNTQARLSIPRQIIKRNIQVKHSSLFPQQLFADASLLDDYLISNQIGKGTYASVTMAITKSSQKKFAIKIYQKIALREPHRLENIKRQVKNLKNMNHKFIVFLIQAIHDKKKIYLVMQYGGKNSMYSILKKRDNRRYTQKQAKKYFRQLLEALSYCHKKKIYHRDIKLQNILINDQDDLKLIDFGFSVATKQKLSSFCGTPSYMAPQIIAKVSYEGQYVDIWACGILLYVMICGSYPFKANQEGQLYRKIKSGKYGFKQEHKITMEGKKLISRMLKIIPSSRSRAQELLTDEWFDI